MDSPGLTWCTIPAPTPQAEERANTATHGVGLLLAIAGAAVACVAAASTGSAMRIVTVSLFAAAMLGVYLTSTVYHALHHAGPWKTRWRLLDHLAIYGLIAGTYTPVCLVAIGGTWGWSLAGVVWGLAAVGAGRKLLLGGAVPKRRWIDTAVYLLMGWVALVGAVPIFTTLSPTALTWLVLGGVFYSVGCVFFLWERLAYNHAVWHGFVLAGTTCHYMLVLLHVAMG